MRLIDADATRGELWMAGVNTEVDGERGVWVRFKEIEKIFDHVPTIDPAKHGRWIERNVQPFTDEAPIYIYRCSVCEHDSGTASRYCPRCGSMMDGESYE